MAEIGRVRAIRVPWLPDGGACQAQADGDAVRDIPKETDTGGAFLASPVFVLGIEAGGAAA